MSPTMRLALSGETPALDPAGHPREPARAAGGSGTSPGSRNVVSGRHMPCQSGGGLAVFAAITRGLLYLPPEAAAIILWDMFRRGWGHVRWRVGQPAQGSLIRISGFDASTCHIQLASRFKALASKVPDQVVTATVCGPSSTYRSGWGPMTKAGLCTAHGAPA